MPHFELTKAEPVLVAERAEQDGEGRGHGSAAACPSAHVEVHARMAAERAAHAPPRVSASTASPLLSLGAQADSSSS